MEAPEFSSIPLPEELVRALDVQGLHAMTQIQGLTLTDILAGRDLLVGSKTGSGKTLAFVLGVLSRLLARRSCPSGLVLQADNRSDLSAPDAGALREEHKRDLDVNGQRYELNSYAVPYALVLCPTRELAEQVSEVFRKAGCFIPHLRVVTLSGGLSAAAQRDRLQSGAHIIVGTPGRILDHLQQESLNLRALEVLVLDEADRMLDMGFAESIECVISFCSTQRQTLLFSATLPAETEELSSKHQRLALRIQGTPLVEQGALDESFIEVEGPARARALVELLKIARPKQSLVFCATKEGCNTLAHVLLESRLSVLVLHSSLDQRYRTEVLTRFSNGSCSILVATDVAARGLDIKDLELVVNYELSPDPNVHIHRIGRTARAESQGMVWNLIGQSQHHRVDTHSRASGRRVQIFSLQEFSDRLKAAEAERPPRAFVPEMITLSIFGGRKQKIRRGDVLGALTGEAGLPADAIGKIDVFDTHIFVAIKKDAIRNALGAILQTKFKGSKLKVRFADQDFQAMLEASRSRLGKLR